MKNVNGSSNVATYCQMKHNSAHKIICPTIHIANPFITKCLKICGKDLAIAVGLTMKEQLHHVEKCVFMIDMEEEQESFYIQCHPDQQMAKESLASIYNLRSQLR